MKKVILNPHNIVLDDIEIKEERVKVLPINSDNKLLSCRINGIYHFIDNVQFEKLIQDHFFAEY